MRLCHGRAHCQHVLESIPGFQTFPVLRLHRRVSGKGPVVEAERARVEAAGGWVVDGRVCDVIAVSRAFGDLQFKEEKGRQEMLQFGVECVSVKPFSCTLRPLNRVVRLWRHANQGGGGVPADAVCIATSKAAKLHGAA